MTTEPSPLPKNYRPPRWAKGSNVPLFHLVLGDDTLACEPGAGTGSQVAPSRDDVANGRLCPDCYHCLKKMEEALRCSR